MMFDVYYTKPQHFSKYNWGATTPKLSELTNTHTKLWDALDFASMEEVFVFMQAEHWSPNGEARALIRTLGLGHTSMSIGDVVRNCDTDEYFVCAMLGFEKLVD
jgi:hypothetical protein